MTESTPRHPPAELLVAFAERRLTNRHEIELHLDECEQCAEAVLIARQLACQADHQIIPELTPEERASEKARLRKLLGASPSSRAPSIPNSASGRLEGGAASTGVWASLGALAGALQLGRVPFGPKPLIATGAEEALPQTFPGSHPGLESPDDAPAQENFENLLDLDVTPVNAPASSDHGGQLLDQQIAEQLQQTQELLDSAVADSHTLGDDLTFAEHHGQEHSPDAQFSGVDAWPAPGDISSLVEGESEGTSMKESTDSSDEMDFNTPHQALPDSGDATPFNSEDDSPTS